MVERATGWLSFHEVNCPSVQVMSKVPKSPPVLVKVVPSEKVKVSSVVLEIMAYIS